MELSLKDTDFLSSFQHIWEKSIDEYHKGKINLFILNSNANEFDYSNLINNLYDPAITYAISRKVYELYRDKPGRLTKLASEKYKEYFNNTGELGELLLYSFLESHLKAPKILSKLEIKTTNKQYVHGSDGVHLLKTDENTYKLIFGESKTIKELTTCITDAINSIYNFKNEVNEKGEKKSGINFEKSLLSTNLEKETFSSEEQELIKSIIYPSKDKHIEIDDAFAIFIGYEVQISEQEKRLPNKDFRKLVHKKVSDEVESKITHIKSKIDSCKLFGHNFYIYVVPFTNLEESRKKIIKEIT